jgi:hypothetical protein
MVGLPAARKAADAESIRKTALPNQSAAMRRRMSRRVYANSSRIASPYGARNTPRSVMIAVINLAGVTSKAG